MGGCVGGGEGGQYRDQEGKKERENTADRRTRSVVEESGLSWSMHWPTAGSCPK